ncbi:MAG: ASKHA domain-containing protein [Promethearchaeota archaeon]
MKENIERIIIDFEPISRRIHLLKNRNIYENLTKAGIQIRSLCGGKGSCGKCKILIERGINFMNPPTNSELKALSKEDIEGNWRLACQVQINKDLINTIGRINHPQFRIYLPDELLFEDFKILTSGIEKGVIVQPAIKKVFVNVQKPLLEQPISDFERILNKMYSDSTFKKNERDIAVNLNILKKIPSVLREDNHQITLTIWNDNEIIECEPGNTIDKNFGIAFDIGTTTIVGYLINLIDGKIHAVSSKLNPQTAYGEDVISRMDYIKENVNGLQELNSAVLQALNDIIRKNCSKVGIETSQIYEATIVGNTVMHHIFLGINPIHIGLSPYIPVVQQNLNIKSKDLKLNMAELGNVYTAPIIAGFVGADTIGVIVSSKIDEENDLTLAIDIGTNGEIIVGNRKTLATGSCAAGSALEGAHIKNGMRAAAGAIDSVKIDPSSLEVHYTTIKNKSPLGICGSGLIDIVAEMLRSKILTRSGNFNTELIDNGLFIKKNNDLEFIIANKRDTSINKDLTISQEDIRQIQMAKAAFYSGTRIILNQIKKLNESSKHDIKQVFLAGAFGNYIDKENARFIGMIPDLPLEKIYQIGNAAGMGAQHFLLNKNIRKKAMKLLNEIQYIEIAIKKEFQREYAEAMYFPHLNLNLFPSLGEYSNISKR